MSENTSTKSVGHPTPMLVAGFRVVGWHKGEEYGRIPMSVIGVPPAAPVMVQAAGAFAIGHGMFGPPGVGPDI